MAEHVFNLYEAKTNLSSLVERAAEGEEIVIARAGKPVAKLVPLSRGRARRKPGAWKGKAKLSRDFEAPLPGELLAAFGGRRA